MAKLRTLTHGAAFSFLLAAALNGCASGRQNTNAERENLITREEIGASDAANMHVLIQRLRPRWLQVRSQRSIGLPTGIIVYQDDLNMGGVDALERIPTEIVLSVRMLSAAEAGTLPRLGSQHVERAIVVHTRRTRN